MTTFSPGRDATRTLKMTVYAISQLKMTDRAAYDRYQARFFDVFRKYNGRLLAADEQPRCARRRMAA
ncbi:uncharacterized protein (DUF1330 family) [Bradyrhizobium sp. USDA 377]